MLVLLVLLFVINLSAFNIYNRNVYHKNIILFIKKKSNRNDAIKSNLNEIKKKTVDQSIIRKDKTINKIDNIENMDACNLAKYVYDLGIAISGSNNNNNNNINNNVNDQILKRIPSIMNQLSMQDITKLMIGMTRLNISWDKIIKINNFNQKLFNYMKSMNEVSIGDVIWSIGSMGARWERFSKEEKEIITQTFYHHINNLSAYSLSSCLWSLAKMGSKEYHYNIKHKQLLIDRINKVYDQFSPQQSSKVLWALGTLGMNYKDISIILLEHLFLIINEIKKSQMGNAITSSQALTGLAKTGIQWNYIQSNHFKANIWEQVTRICQSSNDRIIASAIWAVGTLGTSSDMILPDMKEILFTSVIRILPESSSWELCNILWGFAKMNFQWDDFPKEFQESIILNVVRLQSNMNPIDTGTLLWSLGQLDVKLDVESKYFFNAILAITIMNLDKMKAQELTRTIWGYSGTGISWNMLPYDIQWNINIALRRVGSSMSPQDVANCAYGLSIMSFDIENPSDVSFRGAHETLLSVIKQAGRSKLSIMINNNTTNTSNINSNTVSKSSNSIIANDNKHYKNDLNEIAMYDEINHDTTKLNIEEIEQLRIFAHYLKVMQYVSDTKQIPINLLNYNMNNNIIKKINIKSSKLQERVTKSLEDAFSSDEIINYKNQFHINVEESSFDGIFPVDVAIKRKGKMVALLEIDGPHHYRSDGSLRRKDIMKELMYKRLHPTSTFHRIRWDDENKFGSDMLGTEFVDQLITSCLKDDDIVGNSIRYMQKSMGDFFGWSLRNDRNLHNKL